MEGYKFDYSGYNYPTPVENTNQPLINEVGEKCDTQGYTMGPEYVKLLNECKEQYEEKTRGIDLKDWVDNGNKNETVLLAQEKIEGKNFNYLDYIDENGLPESIKILGSLLLIQQFDINITDENREEIMYNLERFISVILWVESPEKFLNEKGGKVSKQEVNTLNASAQTIMFLVDVMTRKTPDGTSFLKEEFKRAIENPLGEMDKKNDSTYDSNKEIEKTHNAIYEIYSRIHHTNVEGQKNTDTRLNDALNYYYRKNELLD